MPGLHTSMEVANANNTHRGSASQPHDDGSALTFDIKDEVDNGDIFAGSDSDNDGESGGESEYKPRPQLPQPNVNMRNLGSLIRELESGVIDIDPEYQREVVWTAERMIGLIDSLMENYYIPPIILNKKRNAGMDGYKPRNTLVCVDGKQRLSSITAFVKGMIPCHDHRGVKWWFCKIPGTPRRRVLPLETQKMFLEKDFVAYQFTELTPEQEEDLFARVQMGVQLTAAEKMRAKQGLWQELAKLFVEDFPAIYKLMKARARAKDFQLTLACFSQIIEVKHLTAANGVPILKTNYSALPKLLSNTGAVDDAIKSHLASVWTTFTELIEQDPDTFTNADKHLSGVQTFAPVEMVGVTVLISMYSETRNNQLLLGDIKALREALREHFKDLRLHATVWKFLWDFIENLEAIRGAVVGTSINWNQQDQASRSSSSATATVSPTPSVSRKRKAPVNKPLPILPPRDSVLVKNEPQQDTDVSKRQRTDSGPPNDQASTVEPGVSNPHSTDVRTVLSEPMRPPVVATKHPIVENMSAQFGFQEPSPTNSTSASPQLNAIPNQSLQVGPMHTASAPQQHFQTSGNVPGYYVSPYNAPTKKATSTHQQAPHENVLLIPNFSNAPPQAYHQHRLPATQLRAPQQPSHIRNPEPGNHHVPVASMQPSQLHYPTSWHASTTYQDSHNNPTMSSRPPNMTRAHPTSRGAFAPTHTDKQWEGIIASSSPQMPARAPPQTRPVAPPVTVPVVPQPESKKRRSVTRPTRAQYDGAIDLTSDNELEEERQNLLSSFKAKLAPSKQPSASATPAAETSFAPTQRDPVVIHDIGSDEESATINNPYERFKNNPRAGLSGSRR